MWRVGHSGKGQRKNSDWQRLEEFVSKMAAEKSGYFLRVVNDAVKQGKLSCPHPDCIGRQLFLENGLSHHFKSVHG